MFDLRQINNTSAATLLTPRQLYEIAIENTIKERYQPDHLTLPIQLHFR